MRNGQFVATVFGSAATREGDPEYQEAFEIGKRLAGAGFILCNGGYGGTMEASAKGARAGGGRSIGVITDFYGGKPANRWIDDIVRTKTMLERLTRLIDEGDAYVGLSGGTGTLMELSAVWEMMNKKVIERRPCVTLGAYWKNVVELVRSQLRKENRSDAAGFITTAATPEEAVSLLIEYLGIRYET